MMKGQQLFRPIFWITPTIVSDDPRTEPFDEKVYAAVAWFHQMKDGVCKASNQTLAELIKPSDPQPRSVQNSLTRLEECGYIRRDYKDQAKRNRAAIVPLIELKLVRSGDDSQKTNEAGMIVERNGDDTPSETAMTRVITGSKKRSKKLPARSAEEEKTIADVIDAFQEVNPSYQLLFARTPQRDAVWRLLGQNGEQRLLAMVRYLKKTNADRYAPTITTPIELERDMGRLIAWSEKQKAKKPGNGKRIIGRTPSPANV